MRHLRKTFGTLTIGCILCGSLVHSQAYAKDPITPETEVVDSVASESSYATASTPASVQGVREAVRLISQAALQRDFASDGQIRTLLQSAHDKLASSEQVLCCVALAGVARLDSDIRHMVARADNVAGAVQTQDGMTIRPPNREELNLLAKEGQNLLRSPIAQAWTEHESSFAAARNAAPISARYGFWFAGGDLRPTSPAAPGNAEALTLVSVNF